MAPKSELEKATPSNYIMGAGRYEIEGRKFTLKGRGATFAHAFYDDDPEQGWDMNVSWLGNELRAGRAKPVDGTPSTADL